MGLQIYNTMSQQKEEFIPLTAGEVKLYLCGPTVYGLLHVGNFRGPTVFNLIRNWLEKSGYKVQYVYNYTDVDDRIINRAIEEKVDALEIAEKYIGEFELDYAAMKLGPHSANPRVTETMPEIVAMIQSLIEKDKAYVVEGEVLFSVRSFKDYGKLSNKNMDDLRASERVEVDRKKRDSMDFALWKPAKPGEPKWSSPWGEGRPGWHIECSAMVEKLMGSSIDIHGGGMDLIFPHHENEIAQSEGCSGRPFVKYWMHNNMITLGERKMSKSVGNIMTVREFIQTYNAEILKYMLLSVHYRSLSDFSDQGVSFAITNLARIYSSLALAERLLASAPLDLSSGKAAPAMLKAIDEARKSAQLALDDDFNTPEFFAALFSLVRVFNGQMRLAPKITADHKATVEAFRNFILDQGKLMSLFQEAPLEYLGLLDDMLLQQKNLERSKIDELVDLRIQARMAKDFKKSDEIRDQLAQMGIAIQDSPQGTAWEVAK